MPDESDDDRPQLVTEAQIAEWQESGGHPDDNPMFLMSKQERIKRGAHARWTVDADGNDVMPPMQRHYLEDYLLKGKLEGVPKTVWAKNNGVSTNTMNKWQRQEKFIAEWNRRLQQKRLSPEFHEDIIYALRKTALDTTSPQHVKAAAELIKLLGMVQPKQVNVSVSDGTGLATKDDVELRRLAAGLPEIDEITDGEVV